MADEAVAESEECILDRHGECKGTTIATSTRSVAVMLPCRCICHEGRRSVN